VKKILRLFLVWTIISLLLQFGVYGFADYEVNKVLNPVYEPITANLKAVIPGTNLENIQISYAKDYLAYKENGVFKVFNLKKEKVVFEKSPDQDSEKNMGVMGYQWLPDRDALIYFFSKKNPNAVTTVTVQPSKAAVTSRSEGSTKSDEKTITQQPKIEKRYNNPWLTELFTLECSASDEDNPPDNRSNDDLVLEIYPAGGVINQMVFSTYTNLIYLTVKNGSYMSLLEIDVMKDVRSLNRSGEVISNMAVSDQQGTLYLDSKIGSTNQIVAVKNWDRYVISKDANDVILGDRNGKLYLGRVVDNQLTKISTREDKTNINEKVNLNPVWEGSVPFQDSHVVIGASGQVVVYDQKTAYIINNGEIKEIELRGEENYVSPDGAQLIELTKEDGTTKVELKPLN
jgi:hypothetical protein